MDKPLIKLLVVDDDEEDFLIVRDLLSKTKDKRFKLTWASTYEAGLDLVDQDGFAAILVDYNLRQRNGLDFIREVTDIHEDVPTILLTGQGGYEVDVQAMEAGADDFLMKKEINPPLLERTIRYAIEHKQIEIRLRQDAERAELLADLTRDFAEAGFDTRQMILKITRRISETFGDAVIMRTLGRDGRTLELMEAYHPDQRARRDLNEATARTVPEIDEDHYTALLCETSPDKLAAFTRREFASWFEQYPVDSAFVAPLCSHGRLIGILSIIRNTPGGPIPREDQNFYIDLANRAALAIENARLHAEVEHLAERDSLTGFLNRRGFLPLAERELERHQRYGTPLSIIMLDIDHFKEINDTYGHDFGDKVLKTLTESCELNIRKIDIACRYGGDEFVILLPQTELPKAVRVANRIRTCFARRTRLPNGKRSNLTVSIGLTKASEETSNLETLIQKADQALYLAKERGRNRVEVL